MIFFDNKLKQLFVLNILDNAKHVIRNHVDTINNPKEKRVVLLGHSKQDNKVGFILINSRLQKFNQKSQIFIEYSNRNYLDHDCYFDCSHIFEFDYQVIYNSIMNSKAKHIGEISEEDYQIILTYLRESKLIDKSTLKKYKII